MGTGGDAYYYNATTGETSWQHPCDAYYKGLYETLRKQKAKQTMGGGGGAQSYYASQVRTTSHVHPLPCVPPPTGGRTVRTGNRYCRHPTAVAGTG